MPDPFANNQPGLDSPANHAAAVTPNDGADLATAARALYVGTGGNVEVVTVGGETVVFTAVPTGFVLPVRVARVKAASTTANNIVALW
jgi:hypothetical protein